jgi:2',3'-cyclic-nucleotide 2'-phosphodiesterase (5'-nucleotidase family)
MISFHRSAAALFLAFLLSGCTPPAKVQKVETSQYRLSPREYPLVDSVLLRLVQPYTDSVDADFGQVLATSDVVMEKGQPESRLGNFVADVCLYLVNDSYAPEDHRLADFAFFNNGGLRNSLPRGKITKSDVFELMPFDNELVILTLDGATAEKIFNFIAAKGGEPVAGLQMEIRDNRPVRVRIDDMPFDSSRVYKVVTSDYLADGGDQCYFLRGALRRDPAGLKVRDALLRYITEKGKRNEIIHSDLDRRIILTHAQ